MRFAPRIRDSAATRLYRLEGTKPTWANVARARVVKRHVITKHSDNMLRIAASLRSGHVTASLLASRLQAHTDSGVGRALVEYGRLCKTEHVLRYYAEEGYRRRIGTQLNKGEALHAVRRFLVFGNLARLGPSDTEALTNQAACLNLITNTTILWNTVHIQRVLDSLHRRRRPAAEVDITRLSPARHEHINPYGTYRLDRLPAPGSFRPLRAWRCFFCNIRRNPDSHQVETSDMALSGGSPEVESFPRPHASALPYARTNNPPAEPGRAGGAPAYARASPPGCPPEAASQRPWLRCCG